MEHADPCDCTIDMRGPRCQRLDVEAYARAAEEQQQRDALLSELIAILGDYPVGKAKALTALAERHGEGTVSLEDLDEELQQADDAGEEAGFVRGDKSAAYMIRSLAHQCREADERAESLRAALAEKDAELENERRVHRGYREEAQRIDKNRDQEEDALRAETARLRERVNELESKDAIRVAGQQSKLAAFDAAVRKYGHWPPPPEARFVDGRWEP